MAAICFIVPSSFRTNRSASAIVTDGEAEVSVTLIEELVETGKDIFVFVEVVISRSAVDCLIFVGNGKLAHVESDTLKLWVIGDGDDDFTDELVFGVKNGFVDVVTGNGVFNYLSLIDNDKVACAVDNDFIDGVTRISAFDGLTLMCDDRVACV